MQTNITLRNECASGNLHLTIGLECNTTTEEILANVLENSKLPLQWVKLEDPHNRIAAICGSAPSIKDCMDTIRKLQESKADIFALNNCANYLESVGIKADYQIIMDARKETASLVGNAGKHLFASQCHPDTFAKVENPILWHTTYGDVLPDEQDGFDAGARDYCLVGSGISVGITSLVLLYVMGYRTIHIFGMDSCHKDSEGHVLHQSLNDGDPLTIVEFGGKQYVSSFTMKAQADAFLRVANELMRQGVKFEVHGDGLLQHIWNSHNSMTEQDKYNLIWAQPEYRLFSPGARVAQQFIDVAKPKGRVIDFGCGSGKGSLKLHEAGLEVLCMDFADNSRDQEALFLPFIKQDLRSPIATDIHAKYGFCTDVMEHLPPENVDFVVSNIMSAADNVFFQISTIPDSMGDLIGEELHLTVRPHQWWKELFLAHGYEVKWQEEQEIASLFYVTKPCGRKPIAPLFYITKP